MDVDHDELISYCSSWSSSSGTDSMCVATSDDEDDRRQYAAVAFVYGSEGRGERVFRSRLIWKDHVMLLKRENSFRRTYRMSLVIVHGAGEVCSVNYTVVGT